MKILKTLNKPARILLLLITVMVLLSFLSCSIFNKTFLKKATVFDNIEENFESWKFTDEELKVDNEDEIDSRINDFFAGLQLKQPDFMELGQEDKEYLLETVYAAIEDYFKNLVKSDTDAYFDSNFDNTGRICFVFLRIGGVKRASGSADNLNLAAAVYFATINALKENIYDKEISEKEADKINAEVFILGDERPLDAGYEKGIHGIGIDAGASITRYCNNVAAEGNYRLEKLKERLCTDAGLGDDCVDDPENKFFYFPTIHFGTTAYSDEIVSFYRCSDVNIEPEIDVERIKESLSLAEKWMLSNFNSDGYFNYLYFPSSGTYSEQNNMIRQLMSSRWLAEKSSFYSEHTKMHQYNLDCIFDNWYREKLDEGYIYFDSKSKLGANAMALRTLIYSPYFENYQVEALKLANSILGLQSVNGALKAWYVKPDYLYDEEHLLRFYSGEAVLALIEMYQKTGEDKYLDAAISSEDYYMNKYIGELDGSSYFPAFVPWHTICLYKLYMITGDDKYADAIFAFNDKLILMQNQDGKPYSDYLGRFYDPARPEYGVPASASTAVYVEGLCYGYEIAAVKKDAERLYEYKKAILLGAHNLMNLQFSGSDMYYLSHPERVEGAVKTSEDTNSIRIDNTQHTIDAFSRIIIIFK